MRKLKVDRTEGNFFICEDKEKENVCYRKNEMPKEAKCGDMIVISDDGIISVSNTKNK